MAVLGSDTMGNSQHGSIKVVTDVIQGEQPDHLCGKIVITESRDVPDEPDEFVRDTSQQGRLVRNDVEEIMDLDPYKRLAIIFRPAENDASYEWTVKLWFQINEYYVNSLNQGVEKQKVADVLTVDSPVGFDRIGEPVAEYISEQINKDMGSHENRRERIEEQLDNADEIVAAFNEYSTDELLDVFESEN